MTRWTYEIIRALVDDGRDPHPVSVLARAKHRATAWALQPERPPTPDRHHRLAVHLAELYINTITPAAAASYAREVLDEAYRRAFCDPGIRATTGRPHRPRTSAATTAAAIANITPGATRRFSLRTGVFQRRRKRSRSCGSLSHHSVDCIACSGSACSIRSS